MFLFLFLLLLKCFLTIRCEIFTIDARMPNVTPDLEEHYLCYSVPVDQSRSQYIVGFDPKATSNVVHHMLLYGCESAGSSAPVWTCGTPKVSPKYPNAGVCSYNQQTLYAWALDAPAFTTPEGVGFKIGANSNIKYLVMQVHYLHANKEEPDRSGVVLNVTDIKQPKRASIITFGTGGQIAEGTTQTFDAACTYTESPTLFPFAYRVHTHYLGLNVSGHVIRDGSWYKIGRRSPQLPQTFNIPDSSETIIRGDKIAARCKMFNFMGRTVYVGYRSVDEMCNFYIMYYVNGDTLPQMRNCWSSGPPSFSWESYGFKTIPPYADAVV